MIMEKTTTSEIPQSAFRMIDRYEHIEVAPGVSLRCPYYRNPKSGRRRWGLMACAGKGSPSEIEEELLIIEKLENISFSEFPQEKVHEVMRKYRIGIDCSGFIVHVLNAWVLQKTGKPLWSFLAYHGEGFIKKIFWFLRPLSHISVRTLVSSENAVPLEDWRRIEPGDLMVFLGDIDHAALITRVHKDEEDVCVGIEYAHSALENGDGIVKNGSVMYKNPSPGPESQEWKENPDTGHLIYENRSAPLFFRLKIIARVLEIKTHP